MLTNEEIDEKLVNILDFICKNPLIFVSEPDIHSLVMAELMKIPELGHNNLYSTNWTIGMNKNGNPSETKYKTMRVHKEYGHHDMPNARSDIIIISPQDISKIDDPLNLKASKQWIVPDYIFEFGTEKSAGSKTDFERHLISDIKKVKKSKKRGYVIHIQRNLCKSKGARGAKNRNKYEGYSNVIRKSLSGLDKKFKILVIIIDIGNKDRGIYKEGKVKIFKNGKFVGINKNRVKGEIRKMLE